MTAMVLLLTLSTHVREGLQSLHVINPHRALREEELSQDDDSL